MNLKRYPIRKTELLQAWDSADELLLAQVLKPDWVGKRILVLNDQFGALSLGLSQFELTTYTDSFVSAEAIRLNSNGKVTAVHSLDALSGVYDLVAMRIPKNLSFFEDELCRLTAHLTASSQVICTSMIKHLPKSAFELLAKYIGPTTTSLAQKKARLIFARFEKTKVTSPYPLQVKIEGFAKPFLNHSNLFSREKLDIGTRFFLEHIPSGNFPKILDLGCGNGTLGIAAQEKNPSSQLIFSDESFMAIQSARANYEANSKNTDLKHTPKFVWTNCYENAEANSLDLVLCNPPFHQQMAVGDFIAWQMFTDSLRALKPGGMLRVIGNSHLRYGSKLKKIFGNSKTLATNSKFQMVDSVKMP